MILGYVTGYPQSIHPTKQTLEILQSSDGGGALVSADRPRLNRPAPILFVFDEGSPIMQPRVAFLQTRWAQAGRCKPRWTLVRQCGLCGTSRSMSPAAQTCPSEPAQTLPSPSRKPGKPFVGAINKGGCGTVGYRMESFTTPTDHDHINRAYRSIQILLGRYDIGHRSGIYPFKRRKRKLDLTCPR